VFYGDFAAFYCTDFNAATGVREGWIRIYKYSTQMYQLELTYEYKVVASETSTEYAKYSLVKLGADGFLFKEAGKATITRFAIDHPTYTRTATAALVSAYPKTCTETATTSVAKDKAACAAVTGAALNTKTACEAVITAAAFAVSGTTKACTYTYAKSAGVVDGTATGVTHKKNFVMQQVSEDPNTYALATIPAIYGWINDAWFFKIAWTKAGEKLTAVDITAVPTKYKIKMLGEHVSFGRRYVAIMSGMSCASTAPAVASMTA